MREPLLDELPILRELGDELKRAFRTYEALSPSHSQPARPRFRRRLRRVGVVVTAVGILTAFLVGIQQGGTPQASAAAALVQAASIAASQPVPFPRDDQFFYVRSIGTDLEVVRANPTTPLPLAQSALPRAEVTIGQQLWCSADRTGQLISRMIAVRFPTTAGRRLWERLGRPAFANAGVARVAPLASARYLLGNAELSRAQMEAASTAPRALYARLHNAAGSAAEVFAEVADTLRNRPAPAGVRAGLYRTLALVPGILLVGPHTDSVGRRGTAVGFVHNGVEDQLIFDPRSSEILEERTIAITDGQGLRPGTVISSTTYLQREVTDAPTVP